MNEANTMADILGRNESVDEASARLHLTAPRVTPADLEANIASEVYFTGAQGARMAAMDAANSEANYEKAVDIITAERSPALTLLTICILVTRNGFTVIGHSAPASPENYREELGRRYAKENAVRQLWPLMGYALRDRIHRDDLYRKYEFQGHARPEDEARQLLGWLSGDIPELHNVEVPRLHESLERFRARQPVAPPPVADSDDDAIARATAEGMPEPRVAEVAPPPFAGFPPGHPGNPL